MIGKGHTKGQLDDGKINFSVSADSSIIGSIRSNEYSNIDDLPLSGKVQKDGSVTIRFSFDNQHSSLSGQIDKDGSMSGHFYMRVNWSGTWNASKK